MNVQLQRLHVTMPFSVIQLVQHMNCSQVLQINSNKSPAHGLQMECRRYPDEYIFTFQDANVSQNEGCFVIDGSMLNGQELTRDLKVSTNVGNDTQDGCRPRVAHQVTGYRCALCNYMSFSMNSAVQHAKRQHANAERVSNGAEVITEVLQSVYYCTLCDQPTHNSYRWQTHMRRRHNIFVDRRRRPDADPKMRYRKRLASLKDKSFAAIECIVCKRRMRLTESYYLHIRRAHVADDKIYSVALAHLNEIRMSRRQRVKFTMNGQQGSKTTSKVSRNSNIGTSRLLESVASCSSTRYICDLCECTFANKESFDKHSATHSRDTVIMCMICRHVFHNQLSFKEHYDKFHLRHFIYNCDSCGRGFWKRIDKLRHRCKPEMRTSNLCKNELLKKQINDVLKNWKGPVSVQMSHTEAMRMASTLKSTVRVPGQVLCLICNKLFKSMRYYQQHHKRRHLQMFELRCDACCLGFWSRSRLASHQCCTDKRDANIKKQQILAARSQTKLQQLAVPYIIVPDGNDGDDFASDNLALENDGSAEAPPATTSSQNEDLNCEFSDSNVYILIKHNESAVEREVDTSKSVLDSQSHWSDTTSSLKGEASSEESYLAVTNHWLTTDADVSSLEKLDTVTAKKLWPLATATSVEGKLVCNMCLKEIRVQNYHPHMRRVHRIATSTHRPIAWKVCEQCGYRCQDNYKFRRHQMTHSGRDSSGIICELCSHVCYEQMDYNHHFKRRHLGHFSIQCSACGKGFWKTLALRQHVCIPELRDENIRMRKEKELTALRQRDEVRVAMGLPGYGISVDSENSVAAHNEVRVRGGRNRNKK